jgi:carbamoyl-phosphate synthase small subunit
MSDTAHIVTEKGSHIKGKYISKGTANAEMVFTTSYTGYEESLTDPSYKGQSLVFAYPLIGNYGVDNRRLESREIQVESCIMRECTKECAEWFRNENITAVHKVNTRDLVKSIRTKGVLECGIAQSKKKAEKLIGNLRESDMLYAPKDSEKEVISPDTERRGRVAFLDCGAKRSIIEEYTKRGLEIVKFDHRTKSSKIEDYNPDLLFLSNGPGNPELYENAISIVSSLKDKYPVAGICLGQQIIALALGGETEKMKFGHRGTNQPVLDKHENCVRITTQNHQYTATELPDCLEVYQKNVNDGSPEGLRGDEIVAVQYHPEGNPGPNDSKSFFDKTLEMAGIE